MRVLFSCCPAYGHLQPLLPLARAAAQRQHDVMVATAPDMVSRVETAGFIGVTAGRGIERWFEELARRHPDHIWERLEPDEIPQSLLLPRCRAVVCHAGAGTTLAALSHGVPLVVVPQGADQFVIAELCVATGVAVRLLPDEVDADAIGRGVAAVLVEGSYSQAALRVRDEIAQMPDAVQAVSLLEDLALAGR